MRQNTILCLFVFIFSWLFACERKNIHSDHYVHQWVPFPSFDIENLVSGERTKIVSSPGRISMLVFTSSWCIKCQGVIDRIKEIEEEFPASHLKVLYAISHDTRADARAFARAQLTERTSFLSSFEILKTFHNPEIPSVYLSDRDGYMIKHWNNTAPEEVSEIREFIKNQLLLYLALN